MPFPFGFSHNKSFEMCLLASIDYAVGAHGIFVLCCQSKSAQAACDVLCAKLKWSRNHTHCDGFWSTSF